MFFSCIRYFQFFDVGEVLSMHSVMGEYRARLNWISCWDFDGVSKEHKLVSGDVHNLDGRIRAAKLNLVLNNCDMKQFMSECMLIENDSMFKHEEEIEFKNRPVDLNYNEKALIVMTEKVIPNDIKIGLSYGWKFLFPYVNNDRNIHLILSQLEMCINDTVPSGLQNEAFLETAMSLRNRNEFQNNSNVQWLCFVALRTRRFFKDDETIFATRSDKGAHTVVMDVVKYEEALREMLSNSNYEIVEIDPLSDMVRTESSLIKFFRNNFRTKHLACHLYEPNSRQLAQFYGLPKVHKPGFKLRPITAMASAPGHMTGRIFNQMLNVIFPRTIHHVKDSYEMKSFLDESAIMDEGAVLVSFDVVSMYTNIPRKLVIDIIMAKQGDFYGIFGVGRLLLVKIVNFLLVDSAYFTALNNTYRQIEGLPMGGCISTSLARIVMDRVIEHLQCRVDEIYFIRVFVDDTIVAIKRDRIEEALGVLNGFHQKIQFTMEMEDENASINFLNLTLIRDDQIVRTNWYRKCYASGRLLNFYSSHKKTTIMGTAQAFIETVLKLSDSVFFHTNKPRVMNTLRDNGFPETVIIALMNEHYTLMRRPDPDGAEVQHKLNTQMVKSANPNLTDVEVGNVMERYRNRFQKDATVEHGVNVKNVRKFHIFPHSICQSRDIKRILHRLRKRNVCYAESVRNTKVNFVTTRKTSIPLGKRTNVMVVSTCKCGKKFKIDCTKFNQTGESLARDMITVMPNCSVSLHTFKRVDFLKGLCYRHQTEMAVKYIEWKYRDFISSVRVRMPNYHYGKLIKKAKKKLL